MTDVTKTPNKPKFPGPEPVRPAMPPPVKLDAKDGPQTISKGKAHAEVGDEVIAPQKYRDRLWDGVFIHPDKLRADFVYRWVNLRKQEFRRFLGYDYVPYKEIGQHHETAEGHCRLGDTVFMRVPVARWQELVRERQDYWESQYRAYRDQFYNDADKLGGHPVIIDEKTGKELR